MSGRARAAALQLLAACACLLALAACGRRQPVDCTAADNQARDECQAWSGQPQLPSQKYLYSWSFDCSDGGSGTRQVNVTYRSTESCEDARTRHEREPDPCEEFGDEHWPGWRTVAKQPVYPGESCDGN